MVYGQTDHVSTGPLEPKPFSPRPLSRWRWRWRWQARQADGIRQTRPGPVRQRLDWDFDQLQQ